MDRLTKGQGVDLLKEKPSRVVTPGEAIRRAQAIVRLYTPEGALLSDELIEDRRREALRE